MKKLFLTTALLFGMPICLLALFLGIALQPASVTAQTVPSTTGTSFAPTAPLTETPALAVEAGIGTAPCPNPATSIEVQAGDILYFCYTARNTGNVDFVRHILTDTPFISTPLSFDVPLAAGEVITAGRAITMVATNSFSTSALWQAIDSGDLHSATATGPTIAVTVLPNSAVEALGLVVTTTVGVDPTVCATTKQINIPTNGSAEFCLAAKNTGDETLIRHRISSGQLGREFEIPVYALLPGETVEFTSDLLRRLGMGDSLLKGEFATAASVDLTLQSFSEPGESFSASNSATIQVLQANLTAKKYANLTPSDCAATPNIIVNSRQEIYYCIVLQNTGQVELDQHRFVDTAGVGGSFRYPLGPNEQLTITQAALPTIPELTANPLPVLGPFTESITVTHILTWTAQNDTGYQLDAVSTGTINVPVLPLEIIVVHVGDPRSCPGGPATNAVPNGTRVWYCLRVRNASSTPITNHSFIQYMTPPNRAGATYAYTNGTSFVHTIEPGTTLPITTGFFTKSGQSALILGPYTVSVPIADTLRFTNTVIYTASNPALDYQVVANASGVINVSPATATTASTFTPVPTNTSPPTAIPSDTPTHTQTPTPTTVQISALNLPTATPSPQFSIVNGGVTTPLPGQFNSPLAAPVDPAAIVVTPTFTPDIMSLAATQTIDMAATETTQALLLTPTETFTPLPTDTATPLPTYTTTATPSPTATPTATSTQRPVGVVTPDAQLGGFDLLEDVLTSAATAAGWIWFIGGSLTFFVTAGIVAGLTLRPSGRVSSQPGDDFTDLPPVTTTTRPRAKPPARPPATPSVDDDDHWPASLP